LPDVTESDLLVIRRFGNLFDAEVAQSALEAAGVESLVRADDAGGVQPGLWVGRGVDLLVSAQDVDRAQEILDTKARSLDE
jgi:hypothetical protein